MPSNINEQNGRYQSVYPHFSRSSTSAAEGSANSSASFRSVDTQSLSHTGGHRAIF